MGRVWGCSSPVPRASPRDLFVLKQSPYRLFFQCPLYFLVSHLHKRWSTVGCLLCSSVHRVGVSPMCRGKWTLLLPISPPSFVSLDFIFGILNGVTGFTFEDDGLDGQGLHHNLPLCICWRSCMDTTTNPLHSLTEKLTKFFSSLYQTKSFNPPVSLAGGKLNFHCY